MQNILQVSNLKVCFKLAAKIFTKAKIVKAVDDVSFAVKSGEIFGIVGESGSGKSSLVKALIGLNPISLGEVVFAEKTNIHLIKTLKKWRSLYKEIQFIFQDPISALDPRMRVAEIIMEPLNSYAKDLTKKQKLDLTKSMLNKVGLKEEYLERYPVELSGGQCQRVAIARALIVNPKLVICDEATSALDSKTKLQVLNLLKSLQQEMGLTIIFISHDLGTIKHICNRVMVMCLGKIVEMNEVEELYTNPKDPYTKILIDSILSPDPRIEKNRKHKL